MIYRSLFVFENIMCEHADPPGPTIDTGTPAGLRDSGQRAFADYRMTNETCGPCHSQFDPLAFAFEPYDSIGVYRDIDEKGNPTRTDGNYPQRDGTSVAFTSVSEFVELLAADSRVDHCLVKKPLQFALGRALNDRKDACTILDIERAMDASDGSYLSLLVAVAQHPTFTSVRREAREGASQ